MTFAAVAAAALALLALPGLAGRVGARLAPREWVWLCTLAVAAGAVLLEVALVLRSTPAVLAAVGVDSIAAACSRLIAPLLVGGPAVTWAAAVAAAAVAITAARGAAAGRRVRRRLAEDLWFGTHCRIAGHDVVTLPVARPLAASFDAGEPVIVVSRGLLDTLASDEVDAVVRHEAAHLAHRHQRHDTVAAAAGPLLGRLPGVRRSLAAQQLALERCADEDAAAATADGRDVLRRSLLRLLDLPTPPAGVAAFAEALTIAARLDALAAPPPAAGTVMHVTLYAPGALAAAVAGPGLYQWGERFRTVVAMAGHCVV